MSLKGPYKAIHHATTMEKQINSAFSHLNRFKDLVTIGDQTVLGMVRNLDHHIIHFFALQYLINIVDLPLIDIILSIGGGQSCPRSQLDGPTQFLYQPGQE